MQVDYIQGDGAGGFAAHGDVATALLANGMNVSALRTNAVLRKEEWLQFDTAVIEIARQRLVAVGKFNELGLTFNLPNALGTTILQWEDVTDMEPAELSMSGVTEGQEDRLEWSLRNMPIPIVHKDFRVNIRALEASRRLGQPLDVAQAQMAATLVAETLESLIFDGSSVTSQAGATIFGLLTETNRNTGSPTANWDTTATGLEYVDDVITMMAALQADNMYGPYGLWVTYATWNRMLDDYKAESDKTIVQRIQELPNLTFIMPTSNLGANVAVMHQLTNDVAQIVNGMQPTTIQWESRGGMITHFKVMAIMVPRVRSTVTTQSGVFHQS